MTINFCNKSTKVNNTQFSQILLALSNYATNLTNAWNLSPINVVSTPNASLTNPNANTVFLFDNTNQAGALGYHFEQKGYAVGEVFAETTLGYYGSNAILYNGTLPTVSSVMCHETFEIIVNQYANRWWMDINGNLWAGEVCDPVENDIYVVTIPGGTKVSMSNFVYPLWSIPDATSSMGQFDFLNTLHAPFTIKNGYAIVLDDENVIIRYGDTFSGDTSIAVKCQQRIAQANSHLKIS